MKKATMNHSTRKPKKVHNKAKVEILTRRLTRAELRATRNAESVVTWKTNFAMLAGAFTGVIVAYLAGYIPCV